MTLPERGSGLVHDFRANPWFYVGPMLFCLVVHWIAIKTWFSADDFAWLGLPLELHADLHSWLDVFFGPRAQGTVRTLGERAYFLVFTSIFGLNPLPFRLWQFLTQFADGAMLSWIALRLTGSRTAALLAAIFWPANAALAIALDWSSAYNEVCCAFFLLLAFYCLLRRIDTGERRYTVGLWTAFLLGFGALELIVVFPAIAALYAWLFARRYFAWTLWLFLPSIAFTVAHFTLIPIAHDPNYSMHFDAGIAAALWKYFAFATAASRPDFIDWRPVWLGTALAIAMLAAIVWMSIRDAKLTSFCVGWFLLVLLPVLPLQNHFSEYYLTIPSIGLAILLGRAVSLHPRFLGALALLYLTVSIQDIHVTDRYFYQRARRLKKLMLGLQEERAAIANKEVVLAGVDSDLFWSAFGDDPFRLIGIFDVYLSPGSEKGIDQHPEWGSLARYTISIDKAVDDLEHNRAEVLEVQPNGVEDITQRYRAVARAQYIAAHREFVDVGSPLYDGRLGGGWYQIEDGYRWMDKEATVQLAGPAAANARVWITGYCPTAALAHGPVTLTVSAAGIKLGIAVVKEPDKAFAFDFPAPTSAVGRYAVEIKVEVDHTTRIGADVRPLGLIFGTFRMK